MNDIAATTASSSGRPFRPGLLDISDSGVPRLLVSVCTTCRRHFFPARADCPRCGDDGRVEEMAVPGNGTIYSSTVVHVPSPAGLRPPYATGYVHLDAAPLRVFALFTSVDPRELTPGSRVDMVVEPLRPDLDGTSLVSHRFRPLVRGGQA